MPSIRLKHLVSNVWIFLVVSADMVQLSQPYSKVDNTSALYSLIFEENLILLFLQILSSFAMVDVAMAILDFISTVDLLSLVSVAPRYLKALTSSSSCPFMKTCTGVALALFFITLLFSLLTSIPYAPEL